MAGISCNFLSYVLKRAITIHVILPTLCSADIMDPDATHKPKYRYPVLYLLHGYCNDNSSWERYTSIERYAEERNIAVVTFSAENNWYMNLDDVHGESGVRVMPYPAYFDLLEREIPDFVTHNFPISDKPEDTYIAGLSMGGFGAMIHAFGHPEKYRAIGSFSPRPTARNNDTDLSLPVEDYLEPYEPISLLRKQIAAGKKLPDFYYAYGRRDDLNPLQDWFKEELDQTGIPYTLDIEQDYGHEWGFWDIEVRRFLDWIPRTDNYYKESPFRKI